MTTADWSELDDAGGDSGGDHGDGVTLVDLGGTLDPEFNARAAAEEWALNLRVVAERIRDADGPLGNEDVRAAYPKGIAPREFWRDVGFRALNGARTTEPAGAIVRRDVWLLDPAAAPDPETVRLLLRDRSDRDLGRGVGPRDREREAKLRRRAIFGCYEVLRERAEAGTPAVGLHPARLVYEGQRHANVGVVRHSNPQAPFEPPVDPMTGEVRDAVFREVCFPVLAGFEGVHRPPFDAAEAWVWTPADDPAVADLPVVPTTADADA